MAHPRVLPVAIPALLLVASSGFLSGLGLAGTSDHLVISEVMYDPPQVTADAAYEWVEFFNPTGAPVDLSGWALRDNTEQDLLPGFTLGPGQYLVVAASAAGFYANYPGFTGNLVALEDSLGNGLGNAGDRLILLEPSGAPIDAMSYGTDASAFSPPCPDAPEGYSLARVPSAEDTDTAADWVPQVQPNPGGPGSAPTPTSTQTREPTPTSTPSPSATPSATGTRTPTATPTPTRTASPSSTPTETQTPAPTDTRTTESTPTETVTATASATASPSATSSPTGTATASTSVTPTSTATATRTQAPIASPTATPTFTPTPRPAPRIRLNEVLPRPVAVDWDGDGVADAYDAWIELVSLEAEAVDLGGWKLDDVANGGTAPYVFSAGTILAPGAFLVRFRSTTGVALNQDADTARLVAPDGAEVDAFSYTNPQPDQSYSRLVDGSGEWTDAYPPSPGETNRPGTPTPTASPTVTAGVTVTPSATSTQTPTPTSAPTPTETPTSAALWRIRLNEVLPRPDAIDWDGNGTADAYDEWIETQ